MDFSQCQLDLQVHYLGQLMHFVNAPVWVTEILKKNPDKIAKNGSMCSEWNTKIFEIFPFYSLMK